MRTAVAAEARPLRMGVSVTRSLAVLGSGAILLLAVLVLGVGLGSTQVSVGDTAAILASALRPPRFWRLFWAACLLYRAVTGNCKGYEMLGISTCERKQKP